MPYVRVCRTVNTEGKLVSPDEVDDYIKSQPDYEKDPWFMGTYELPDEALTYVEGNNNKIKGYTGSAYTSTLYWDLDDKDLEKVKDETISLALYLCQDFGVDDGLEVYFSGNKGFHILLRTDQTFTPAQVKRITARVAREAGAKDTYDSAVYNTTRIFRYPNTKHPASGLWKIPLAPAELGMSIAKIKQLAESPRTWEQTKTYPGVPVKVDELVEKFDVEESFVVEADPDDYESALNQMRDLTGDLPFERQCISILQEGKFGPGERENALIRMAAYYKNLNYTFEQVHEKLTEALENRSKLYDDLNPYSDADTIKTINSVFDPAWRGGMYSCKTDTFLIEKCSNGGTCCMAPPQTTTNTDTELVFGVGGLIKNYIKHGDDALLEFPKTGLSNLDHFVKLRRQNLSIVAGAPGSGKTSICLEIMESLNRQKINHIFFSLDMASTSLFEMIALRYTNYTSSQIEAAFSARTRDFPLMREIAERVKQALPYSYFDVSTAVDLKHIGATIKNYNEVLDSPIQVCFVDYAGRLMGSGDSSFQKASANALLANDIAKTSNSHMMFIAQTSRESGDHTTPIHSNRVSKDSSEWEANATFVLSVWRPFGSNQEADDNYMHMYIGKNRNGQNRELYFKWNGSRRKITPLTDSELSEYSDLCTTHNKPLPNKRALDRAVEQDKAYTARTEKAEVPNELEGKNPEEIRNNARDLIKHGYKDNNKETLRSRTGSSVADSHIGRRGPRS